MICEFSGYLLQLGLCPGWVFIAFALINCCQHMLAFDASQSLNDNVFTRLASSPSQSSQQLVTATWRPKLWAVASSAFSLASLASHSCSQSSQMLAAYLPDSCRSRMFSTTVSIPICLSIFQFKNTTIILNALKVTWGSNKEHAIEWAERMGILRTRKVESHVQTCGNLKVTKHFHNLEGKSLQPSLRSQFGWLEVINTWKVKKN